MAVDVSALCLLTSKQFDMQALIQDTVLKYKKDGKMSPKTQQSLESDTQQVLSLRN